MQAINPWLLIVNGPPGVGKSTLATQLGSRLKLPVFHKDELKEVLADAFQKYDVESSRAFERVSYILLYNHAKTFLHQNVSIIIEANFRRSPDTDVFLHELSELGCSVVQLFCSVAEEILVNRYNSRRLARHPIHLPYRDSLVLSALSERLSVKQTIDLDLSDFDRISYEGITDLILHTFSEGRHQEKQD